MTSSGPLRGADLGSGSAPLRVLVVGQAAGTPGGISSVQRLHVRFLDAREDVAVRVVTTYDEVGLARRLRLMVGGIARALTLIVGRRVDVVHLHVAKGLSALRKGVLVAAARAVGIPTVLHTHAGAFAEWFDGLPRPVRALVARLLWADRVVVLAPDARAVYTSRLGLPDDRVVVLANPVELPPAIPERDPHAEHVGGVFLGRFIDRKGVFDLIEAVAALQADHRERLHLTLAGHGDVDAVRRAVAEAGLERTVDVRTWIGPEERDELLGDAQLLLLPSWWEGLPMSVLEGMAWGLCPVVTPVGGLATLVRDGDNGVVVGVHDPAALAAALDKLLSDDEVRVHLGARARESVTPYGAAVWADRLVGLYRELLSP
ncbi:glycosyltransferase family 4 protein [Actinomycetospora termitidis]|uniref:Glycosyltransferase family 4 protein n=1 Tax=Actinomycetospora termitidis TaxID=3053470 RepID=A0ABT7M791_9PSEU|nr:glycosyltransferase family 4 protein [Actinomycetospora sp. Odt1-22]MDL5155672.1 glycosyltransferase family 4 protein [Actinomycetospora sp. Odt1-22]